MKGFLASILAGMWLLVALPGLTAASFAGVTPGKLDLNAQQYERFTKTFILKDSNGAVMNLTGYSYKAQIRKGYDTAVAAADFGVTIAPLSGQVELSLTSAQTGALVGDIFYWDLQQTEPGGNVSYLLKGRFSGNKSATKP